MLLRRGFFGWLIPAAFLLPLWLFVGWAVTGGGGWALLWVLLLAMPGVFVWQLVLTLLVRARGTVRAHRTVSWWDVLGFGVWHLLVVALGFFDSGWWAATLAAALLVGVALFWLELWQLWREARPGRIVLKTSAGVSYLPPTPPSASDARGPDPHDVIVVPENRGQTPG